MHFLKLILKLEDKNDVFKENNVYIPAMTVFVEQKREIDRSTLYIFDGPFQLFQADVVNLEFLGKYTVDPQYCLLFVDLITSKVYTCLIKSRRFIMKRMKEKYTNETSN